MTPQELCVELERTIVAPSIAREAVSDWLRTMGYVDPPIGDVALVVSELVTNAIVHGDSAPVLRATHDYGRLRLEVDDESSDPPRQRLSGPVSGGFGLNLVANLTEGWGWIATRSGKRVWAELLC